MCCSFVSSFAGCGREEKRSKRHISMLSEIILMTTKRKKIVNEKYPEVLQRLKTT